MFRLTGGDGEEVGYARHVADVKHGAVVVGVDGYANGGLAFALGGWVGG